MMKKSLQIGLSIGVVTTLGIGFSGCGSSGGDSSDNTVQTGTLVDAPIQGVAYSTATQSGITDSQGHFKYKTGEVVTFKIGNLMLGSVTSHKNITPLTLGGDASLSSVGTKATNIARILQTLDANSSNDNIIVIPSELKDLNVTNIDLTNEADLNTILQTAQAKTSKTYNLVDSNSAKTKMTSYLNKYLFNGTYSVVATFDSSKSSQNASYCGSSSNWTFIIDTANRTVTGYNDTKTNSITSATQNYENISGSLADGTNWNAIFSPDGTKLAGQYNYGNGECVGTIRGTKN